MSSLFRDREQQDSHEFLRCILLYIQEATRAINQQRAVHCEITKSPSLNDSNCCLSTGNDAGSAADVSGLPVKNDSLSESVSFCSPPHSALQNRQPDGVDSTSPTATTRVSPMTSQHDCLITSSSASSGSSQIPTPTESEPLRPKSTAGTISSALDAKKTPSAAKITNYFAVAPAAPKTASDIAANTSKVLDFVEVLCEGKNDRTTRCLECECRTRCTETFQDVEVVAQKAISRVKVSNADSSVSDDDDDDDGERSTIYSDVIKFKLYVCMYYSF